MDIGRIRIFPPKSGNKPRLRQPASHERIKVLTNLRTAVPPAPRTSRRLGKDGCDTALSTRSMNCRSRGRRRLRAPRASLALRDGLRIRPIVRCGVKPRFSGSSPHLTLSAFDLRGNLAKLSADEPDPDDARPVERRERSRAARMNRKGRGRGRDWAKSLDHGLDQLGRDAVAQKAQRQMEVRRRGPGDIGAQAAQVRLEGSYRFIDFRRQSNRDESPDGLGHLSMGWQLSAQRDNSNSTSGK